MIRKTNASDASKVQTISFFSKLFGVKNKIFFSYVLSLFLFLALVISIINTVFINTLMEMQLDYSIELSKKTKYNLEFFLDYVDRTSKLLSTNTDLRDNMKNNDEAGKQSINNMLNTIASFHQDILGVYIFGYGNAVYSSNPDIDNQYLRDFFIDKSQPFEAQADFEKETIQLDTLSDMPSLIFRKQIYDYKANELYGYLVIDISFGNLRGMVTTSASPQLNKILVVNESGQQLFTYPYNIYLGDVTDKYPEILEKDSSRINGEVFGLESLIVTDTINYSDWKVISIHPLNSIRAVSNDLIVMIFFYFILFSILALMLAYVFAHRITKPLNIISDKIKQIDKGDLSVQIDVHTKDELEHLANSFNSMIVKVRNLINEKIIHEKHRSEMEFNLLQAQINPHFLYNTLDSIRWVASIQNVPSISNMVQAIISMLKYNFSRKDFLVPLKEEIDSVKNYIFIQKYRYGDTFDIVYNIPEDILECKTIKFILQPVVENAIYHGFKNMTEIGLIIISAYIKGKYLYIHVKDNGRGINQDDLKNIMTANNDNSDKYIKIGINNVDERIKFYYGQEYGITIKSEEYSGTEVIFKLLNDIVL